MGSAGRWLCPSTTSVALILEDPGGQPLTRLIQGPMEVKQFLHLAVGLANALRQLQKRKLIHKDLKTLEYPG